MIQICYSLEFVQRLDFEWGEEKLWIEKSLTHTLGTVNWVREFLFSSSHYQSFECISCQSEKFVRESRRVTQSFGINLLFVLAEFFDLELENKTLSQFWIHEGETRNCIRTFTEKSSSQRFNQTNGLTNRNYFMNHNRKLKKAPNQTWQFYFLMTIWIKNLPDREKRIKRWFMISHAKARL